MLKIPKSEFHDAFKCILIGFFSFSLDKIGQFYGGCSEVRMQKKWTKINVSDNNMKKVYNSNVQSYLTFMKLICNYNLLEKI